MSEIEAKLDRIRRSAIPSPTDVNFICRTLQIQPQLRSEKVVRIGLVGTTTLEPLLQPLTVRAHLERFWPEIYFGPFNRVHEELRDINSGLYAHRPEFVFLSLRLEELSPKFIEEFTAREEDDLKKIVQQAISELKTSLSALRSNFGGVIAFNSLTTPEWMPYHQYDWMVAYGMRAAVHEMNQELATFARTTPDVVMLDSEQVTAFVGRDASFDPKLWYWARYHGSSRYAWDWSGLYLSVVRNRLGFRRKCLVLDLDNTMWGGIIGEDGMDGIKIGGDYPGNIYQAFQKQVLDLWRQGVILALNSKNNESDAKAVFDEHPEMILQWDHFAVKRVNWSDKVSNLREIAAEINIGLESLVFVDDNPAECEFLCRELPQVTVLQMPTVIEQIPRLLAQFDLFASPERSAEDRKRNVYYQADQAREAAMSISANVEDFVASLEMVADIGPINGASLARSVQLLEKTNQFNLTTKRHNATFIKEIAQSPLWRTYTLRLVDRFGDNGQVGLALVRKEGDAACIDTFLMSCRVIGRGAEDAMLALIARDARAQGATQLIGEYTPTKKNKLVESFYESKGFELKETLEGERRIYCISLAKGPTVECKFIKVREVQT
ncbi:HAD-IIIC family phosphatase [Microvirga vignae]|uniref:HAD-IIIC family phosphatase n=1 Tax=Microvirga vignae TaxID=1225564 RepID=UPI000699BC31|nr:HAD-IIIC family phosphatase [Microvirga vignae]